MSSRTRRRRMIAIPSNKSIRRQRPEWDDDARDNNNMYSSSSTPTTTTGIPPPPPPPPPPHDDFEASFLSEYGSSLLSHLDQQSKLPSQLLTNNNKHWGLQDVRVERSLRISPPVIHFGDVQRGAVSTKTIRLHNCTGHITRARVVPFKAFSLLEEDENFLKSNPNCARISAGLSVYVTITLVGRNLGTFKEMLRIHVSEHDLMYEIPVMGNVLAESGFADAVRCNELARKMKKLEINLLEKTNERPFAALIPSSELTLNGESSSSSGGGGDGGGGATKATKKVKISLGGYVAGVKNKKNPLEMTEADVPTFPNARWNTFTNTLRTDHRNRWKVEPDPNVKVGVIKKRYEQMVAKSKSKWSNIEGRFHMAKMISRVSGITPRLGVMKKERETMKTKRTAADIAFGKEEKEERSKTGGGGGGGDGSGSGSGTGREKPTPRSSVNIKNVVSSKEDAQASTVNMSAQQRKEADRKTETKLLGELGIKKSIENPEDAY
jgi:uncharacterized membrane protein YgcG